jgi:hypothetical protein
MITIKIKTSNAAFEGENYGIEVARILRRLAIEFETTDCETKPAIRDINGNTVGSCKVTKGGKG